MPIGAKGHVRHPDKDLLIQLKHLQYAHVLRSLRQDTPPAYDARAKGIIGPVKDQSECGSCWDFSGTFVVETALYLAGILKPDGSQALSEEYTLDCGRNGGCGGDDNVTVLDWAKKTGLPLSKDYGPYSAQAGSCQFKPGMQLFRIDDWFFVDSNGGDGVTPTQAIKTAIMAYGCVGCAVAAGGDSFWNSGQGIGAGRSHNIDHDVALVGWDDSQGGGAWIMRNSWGASWGNQGYAWVKYGAYDIGTEAVAAKVVNPNPVVLPPDLWA